MSLSMASDLDELRHVWRRALSERVPSARLRAALRGDAELWELRASARAAHGLRVPESQGGSEATALEQTVLLEEAGRVLLPGPFFATVVLAGSLLLAAESGLLPALADGTLRAGFAWSAADQADTPLGPAEQGADGWTVSGEARGVLDGAEADVLLVLGDGPVLLAVARDQRGVTCEPLVTLDLTRPAATVRLDQARGSLVSDDPTVVRRGLQHARLGLAAEQVGGAQRCLDLAVQHALLREQFGRRIGSFQAVKHKLADMAVRVELARSAVWFAAREPEDARWTLAAAALCSETYLRVATDCIQVHGGIGFTWEHDAHLHYRRARADHAMLGTPRQHRRALAELIA